MNKLVRTVLICAMAIPNFCFATPPASIPNVHEKDEGQVPVYSCLYKGEIVRFKKEGLLYLLQGANGNPDGMIAKDTTGKPHAIYYTKDSPYKCEFVYEIEG